MSQKPLVIRKRAAPAPVAEEMVSTRQLKLVQDKNICIENLKSLIQTMLDQLLNFPERSSVTILTGMKTTVYQIDIAQEDFGRFVGPKGKHINALRVIVSLIAWSNNFRAVVQIKDEDRFF